MLNLTRGRWRAAATAMTATALTAGTLAFAAAPAQAAEPATSGNVLSWGVSAQFSDHFSPKPYAPTSGVTATDGATYAGGIATFSEGVATVDGAGDDVYSYDGTITGAFIVSGVEQYAVTITDPVVTVDEAGAGALSAVVSARNAAAQGNPADATTPARVTVAEFTGGAVSANEITAIPNWAGVLLADSQAAIDLGIGAGKPVDGKSFHPDFLGQLTVGTRAHFYASGATSDSKKPVAAFTVSTPAADVTAAAAVNGDYVDVDVNGTGFLPSSRPGAQGVYVAFGPKKDIFALNAEGEVDGASAFPAAGWINAASIAGGAFSTSLAVEKAKLVKGVEYAVYTWTAHGNPTAGDSQYTETVVSIPGLPKNVAKLKTKVTKKSTVKKAGKLKATVTGIAAVKVTGKVTVTLKKGKASKKVKATLNAKGIAKIKLPKLAKGKWKATVVYNGDANYKGAAKKLTLKIKK